MVSSSPPVAPFTLYYAPRARNVPLPGIYFRPRLILLVDGSQLFSFAVFWCLEVALNRKAVIALLSLNSLLASARLTWHIPNAWGLIVCENEKGKEIQSHTPGP